MSLRFVTAAADITPSMPTELSGFASRCGLATGTLDPLQLRLLLLSDGKTRVAIAAFDLLGIPDDLGAMISARLAAPMSVIPCATHTHAGPPVLAQAMLGAVPPGLIAHLAAQTAALIDAAAGRMRDCSIAHRKTPVPGIAHNRRDPSGPVDHRADVVTLRDAGGTCVAAWINFACHPVVLGPDNPRYSADFPGAARRRLESRLGVPVLYSTGACGQINLGHSALDSIRRIGLDRRTPEEAERIGAKLADLIADDLQRDPPAGVDVSRLEYAAHAFPARYAPVDEASRAAIAAAAYRTLQDGTVTDGERRMAEIDLAWLAGAHAASWLELATLRAGPLACVFLPGEIFVETALALQASQPGAMVVGYAFKNPGYIPHRSALGRGGYEVDVAWRPYGAPGPFAADTAEKLEIRARELLAGAG
jgi:hypothetical protein